MGKVQILDRTTGLAYLTSFPIIDTLAVFTIYHTILYDIVLLDNNSQQNGDDTVNDETFAVRKPSRFSRILWKPGKFSLQKA